jgi:dinuclear metal center YbgI/SA1388 family protein
MFVNSRKIANIIEEIAPIKIAQDWDNVGFQIGNENLEIGRVMVALEITEEVLNEAIDKNIDLIVTHHPLIFKKINCITTDDPIQRLVIRMIKKNINLYVAHTNIDVSKNGTNYYLSELLNLNRVEGLDMVELDYLYKISVFVPKNYSEKVRNVLFKYHAGEYGNYDEASFISYGTGTFRPLEGSNPYMGEKNKLENVEELKIEVVIDKKYLDIAIENMLSAHPYETVAYDIIKLENISNKYSLGITGYLEKGMEIEELAEVVKEKFKINMLKIVRSNNKKNGKIAICSGAGSEYIEKASKLGCKCLITGDVKYHEAQLARQLNINVIDAGHFETENIYIEYFAKFIKNRCIEKEYDVKIIQSENIINPFEYK